MRAGIATKQLNILLHALSVWCNYNTGLYAAEQERKASVSNILGWLENTIESLQRSKTELVAWYW